MMSNWYKVVAMNPCKLHELTSSVHFIFACVLITHVYFRPWSIKLTVDIFNHMLDTSMHAWLINYHWCWLSLPINFLQFQDAITSTDSCMKLVGSMEAIVKSQPAIMIFSHIWNREKISTCTFSKSFPWYYIPIAIAGRLIAWTCFVVVEESNCCWMHLTEATKGAVQPSGRAALQQACDAAVQSKGTATLC